MIIMVVHLLVAALNITIANVLIAVLRFQTAKIAQIQPIAQNASPIISYLKTLIVMTTAKSTNTALETIAILAHNHVLHAPLVEQTVIPVYTP